MQHRQLGRTKIEISAIIFGGWQAGKSGWAGIDDAESIAAHQAAFDSGITTFDTAEAYGEGHSEQILAQALGSKRDQIIIASKVFADHLKPRTSYRSLRAVAEKPRHGPDGLVPNPLAVGKFRFRCRADCRDTMGALLKLKEQGKIRAVGVSNFSRAQLQEAAGVGAN